MKKTALALCAFAILGGAAQAQTPVTNPATQPSTLIRTPASTTPATKPLFQDSSLENNSPTMNNSSSTTRDGLPGEPGNSNRLNNDVSNVETQSSYKPIGIYDTDGDGMMDTSEFLRGPINPTPLQTQPLPDSSTQPLNPTPKP